MALEVPDNSRSHQQDVEADRRVDAPRLPVRSRGSGKAKITLGAVRATLAGSVALLASAVVCQLTCSTASAAPAVDGQRTPAVVVAADDRAIRTDVAAAGKAAPLKVYEQIKVPVPANAGLISAEAPNGAVFLAQVGETNKTVVWVVDGNGPVAVAEHVSGAVQALAADSENLYVATFQKLIAFNRRTGNQVGEWAVPRTFLANASDAQLLTLSAFNGKVFVLATLHNDVDIYLVNASSAATPRLVAVSTSAAPGPNGSVYFVRTDHHLSYMSAAGAIIVGPQLAFHPNGLGGGVQFVNAVAGGVVWVVEPAGQGLDATFSSYGQQSLKQVAHWDQPVDGQIVSTESGALVLGGDGFAGCPQHSQGAAGCVYRLSSTGVMKDATAVGSARALLGPEPSVVTSNASGSLTYLDRLT
jgi:hypothetical protein